MISAIVSAQFRSAFKVSNTSHYRLISSKRPHLLEFIDRVEQKQNRKVEPSFFIRMAQKADNSQEIRVLIQEAEKRWGKQLNSTLLASAANRATQIHDPELAIALLRRVPKVDILKVHHILLRVLSITDSKKLIDEIITSPVLESINLLDLCSLLKFCDRCGDVELAERVLTWGKVVKISDSKLDPFHMLGIRLRVLSITDSKQLIEEIIASPAPKSTKIADLGALLKFCEQCVDVELAKRVWSWGKVVRDSNPKEVGPTMTYLMLCGKTGDLEFIKQVWNEIVVAGLNSRCEVIGAMLSVLAAHGDVNQVERLLAKVPPDQIDQFMLASALTAYSHKGLAKEAWNFMKEVESKRGSAVVGLNAYSTVIDAFARKGDFQSAFDIIEQMTERGIIPDSVTWMAILSPCRQYKELPTALQAFEAIKKLNYPTADVAAAYVVMADVYEALGNLVAADALREERRSRGLVKEIGAVTTTVHGKTHTFHVNLIPPELSEAAPAILAKLDEWSAWLVKQGVSTESIECRHSEKLALAYAVCQKEKTVTLRKNLRVCTACHEASVQITKFESITIHHWDRSRLHVMKDGKCSCGDYY